MDREDTPGGSPLCLFQDMGIAEGSPLCLFQDMGTDMCPFQEEDSNTSPFRRDYCDTSPFREGEGNSKEDTGACQGRSESNRYHHCLHSLHY